MNIFAVLSILICSQLPSVACIFKRKLKWRRKRLKWISVAWNLDIAVFPDVFLYLLLYCADIFGFEKYWKLKRNISTNYSYWKSFKNSLVRLYISFCFVLIRSKCNQKQNICYDSVAISSSPTCQHFLSLGNAIICIFWIISFSVWKWDELERKSWHLPKMNEWLI